MRAARFRPVLLVEGLFKTYGTTVALDGVDLEIAAGDIVGLLGRNGAGKTSLVSIVAGLRRADTGRVTVNGVDALRAGARARSHLGLAPQELGVYPTITVRHNLELFGDIAGLRRSALPARVDEVAAMLELSSLVDRRVSTLSGGEKRRVHTAMAMMHRPALLMLDEPTTGVDVQTRRSVLAAVRRVAEEGSAVCYSTHYLPEVEELGASVAILDHGRIIAQGTMMDLLAAHGTPAFELVFDGPPPEMALSQRSEIDGNVVRVFSPDPARDCGTVLAQLGLDTSRLRSVEILRPSLESVFLALTGHRYANEGESVELAS